MSLASDGAGQKAKYEEIKAWNPHLIVTSVENWDELIKAPSIGVIGV
jgi:hypothetical protein